MANVSPGDIIVNSLTVISPRGTLELGGAFMSMSIYESIFTPGIVCDIFVLDTQDQLGTLKLSGDETVFIQMQVAGGVKSQYYFALYEISDLDFAGAQKSKTYTLRCVSEEAMYAKTNFVTKAYSQLCSQIIKDIHKNYLKSDKDIILEDTVGAQTILIPNKNPYEAISLVRKRAISHDNVSSVFVYFETRINGNQIYKFVTIESMFGASSIKSFIQSDAINVDSVNGQKDNNILAYSVPKQFSSIDKIVYNGQRIITFNTTTQEFSNNVANTSDTAYKTGGSTKTGTSVAFQNKYKSDSPSFSLIPIDNSQRPVTNIAETTPDYGAYLAILMQNAIKIRVPGDTALVPGAVIDCSIPNKQGLTGPLKDDPLLSGKFVISRIHHRIGLPTDKPRYTCIIECIKGKYNTGVQ
jgi:hypothetical protein